MALSRPLIHGRFTSTFTRKCDCGATRVPSSQQWHYARTQHIFPLPGAQASLFFFSHHTNHKQEATGRNLPKTIDRFNTQNLHSDERAMSFLGCSIPSPAAARPSSQPSSSGQAGELIQESIHSHGGRHPRTPIRILSEAHINSTRTRINRLDGQTAGLFNTYLRLGRVFHSLPQAIRQPFFEINAATNACREAFAFDPAEPEQTSAVFTALKSLQDGVGQARQYLARAEENDLRVVDGLTVARTRMDDAQRELDV